MMKSLLRIPLLILTLTLGARAASPSGYDFGPWPAGADPQHVGKRVAERFLQKDYRLLRTDVIHYVETCTWYGALSFARLTRDDALNQRLIARFQPLFGDRAKHIPPVDNVDFAVFGSLPLELYMRTKEERYLKLGLRIADEQWTTPSDQGKLDAEAREAVAKGLSWHTRFWIDDMYMITMLQTQAYRATGDAKYLDRAANEAVAYLEKLQQPNGLFYHAPDVPFFWGRGDGWFAAGMSELLRAMPENHPQRARILESYRQMMATLLKYQDENGMWHQLIDDPKSWAETSCTGMFTFAFITGVKYGWLDAKTYGPAARKGWLALMEYIEPNGDIREVCEGTNKLNDRQYYLDRKRYTGDLHGQAPILWCASAFLGL